MKKYCKNCLRWYATTETDQCDIPNPGFISEGKIMNKNIEENDYYKFKNNFNKAIGAEDISIKKYNEKK